LITNRVSGLVVIGSVRLEIEIQDNAVGGINLVDERGGQVPVGEIAHWSARNNVRRNGGQC